MRGFTMSRVIDPAARFFPRNRVSGSDAREYYRILRPFQFLMTGYAPVGL